MKAAIKCKKLDSIYIADHVVFQVVTLTALDFMAFYHVTYCLE